MKQATLEALQIAIEADVPVLLWGGPGTGKTSGIEALAEKQGWAMETVIASLREPADFAGLPVISDGKVTMAPPDWAERLSQEQIGSANALLFLDEMSTATPAVQAALLRVVFGRQVGDTTLGENVRVVAAANEIHEAAGGWDLAPPTANRFMHLNWEVNSDVVVEGLAGNWPTASTLTIEPGWRDGRHKNAIVVASFLKSRPTHIHAVPTDEHQSGKAWPSPRTWDAVIDVLTVADHSGCSDDAVLLLVSGLVGDGPGQEMLTYRKNLDLPDPEDLLKDPTSYKQPDTDDKTFAVVMSVVHAVTGNLTAGRWHNGLLVLIEMQRQGKKDIAGTGVRSLMMVREANFKLPPELKEFIPMLKAGGLMPDKS